MDPHGAAKPAATKNNGVRYDAAQQHCECPYLRAQQVASAYAVLVRTASATRSACKCAPDAHIRRHMLNQESARAAADAAATCAPLRSACRLNCRSAAAFRKQRSLSIVWRHSNPPRRSRASGVRPAAVGCRGWAKQSCCCSGLRPVQADGLGLKGRRGDRPFQLLGSCLRRSMCRAMPQALPTNLSVTA